MEGLAEELWQSRAAASSCFKLLSSTWTSDHGSKVDQKRQLGPFF